MTTIDFKPGDLLEVVRHKCHTLCKTGKPYLPELRECPVEELEVRRYPSVPHADIFENLEGRVVLVVDVAKVTGAADMNESARQRGLKWMGVILPILSVLCYLFYSSPVALVLISGTMQAIMLPMIGFAVLYFRYKKSDKRLIPGKLWDFFLWLSFAGFLVVGIYQTYAKLFQ